MPLSESIPAITIGLPCYGRPAYLKAALDHLLGQTFADFVIHVSENPSGAEDIREIVDITALNAEIARIVIRQSELRTAIDAIVADLEGTS